MLHTLWSEHISIHENFVDADLLQELQKECDHQIATIAPAGNTYSLINQNINDNTSLIMNRLFPMVEAAALEHCMQVDVDWDNLEYTNCQVAWLNRFNEHISRDAFHEPHHDMAENVFINTILYVSSEYEQLDQWVGGELILYKDLSCGQFPKNTVRIKPLLNRLIVFSAFNIHRVNPYFGNTPRTAIINCWGLRDLKCYPNRIL